MFLIIYFSHRKKSWSMFSFYRQLSKISSKMLYKDDVVFIFRAKFKCYAQIFCIFFSVHLVQFFPLYQTDKKLLSTQMFFNRFFSKNTKNSHQIFRTLPKSLECFFRIHSNVTHRRLKF